MTVFGCCCSCIAEPCEAIYLGPSGKPFPAAWGKPPEIQTKDYRPLPYGYGHGSSTLYHWIQTSVMEGCKARGQKGCSRLTITPQQSNIKINKWQQA